MRSNQHKRLLVGMLASCLWVAGCASVGSSSGNAPEFRDKTMSAQQASAAIGPGSSTKADVMAALGPANVVKFDSGYEVWIYRSGTGTASAEFVMLFTPEGIVKKTRIRSKPER